MEVPDELAQYVKSAVLCARASEGLAVALAQLTKVAETIGDIAEIDGSIGPELRTALDQIGDLSETFVRAATFLEARSEVAEENFIRAYGA